MKLIEIIIGSTLIIFITFITSSIFGIVSKRDKIFGEFLKEHVNIVSFFSYPTGCQMSGFYISSYLLTGEFCNYKNFYIRKLKNE